MELYLIERVIERDAVIRLGKRYVSVDLHPFGPVKASLLFDDAGEILDMDVKKGQHQISSMHFMKGQPHGGRIALFYPDGHLREEGLFKEGLRTGKWEQLVPFQLYSFAQVLRARKVA